MAPQDPQRRSVSDNVRGAGPNKPLITNKNFVQVCSNSRRSVSELLISVICINLKHRTRIRFLLSHPSLVNARLILSNDMIRGLILKFDMKFVWSCIVAIMSNLVVAFVVACVVSSFVFTQIWTSYFEFKICIPNVLQWNQWDHQKSIVIDLLIKNNICDVLCYPILNSKLFRFDNWLLIDISIHVAKP